MIKILFESVIVGCLSLHRWLRIWKKDYRKKVVRIHKMAVEYNVKEVSVLDDKAYLLSSTNGLNVDDVLVNITGESYCVGQIYDVSGNMVYVDKPIASKSDKLIRLDPCYRQN